MPKKKSKLPIGVFMRGDVYYARYSYTGSDGKRRSVEKKAESFQDAKDKRKELEAEYSFGGEEMLASRRKTMIDLADYFKKHYTIEPTYVEGRRVKGQRGWKERKRLVEIIASHFRTTRLRDINYGHLRRFRDARLAVPVSAGRSEQGEPLLAQRRISTVNREMSCLRRMLRVAESLRWITRTPFRDGDPLINISDERGRRRILSLAEEESLLAACLANDRRKHLRAIIICALDTAMRKGEILKLQPEHVQFTEKRIYIPEFHTKTMQERFAPLTKRLAAELAPLCLKCQPGERLFQIKDNVKRSFATACRTAKIGDEIVEIKDLRFHDLRRTAATRLHRGGMPIGEVSRILGHKNVQTTYRYIGVDEQTTDRAGEILDAFNEAAAARSIPQGDKTQAADRAS